MDLASQRSVFTRWLAEYRGLLFKVVRAYADEAADRDDLFQDIAVALWKSVPRYRGESAETTWIYRVALYTAVTWLRKEKRRRHENVQGFEHVLVTTPEAAQDPRLDWMYSEIRQLEVVDRSVALMMLDGLSYAEIAEALGVSVSYVGVRLNRIKKKLVAKAAEEQHEL